MHRYYSATILKVAGFSDATEAIWLAAAVSFCNLSGSCVGLFLVERSGRRQLTLFSLGAVVVALLGLSVTFYAAQHQSERADSEAAYGAGAACDSYQYCFDCVQDSDCGFCTDLRTDAGASSGRSACISKASDDDGALYPGLCPSDDFYGDSCPGHGVIGWVIFMGMCVYLLVFSPGMGPMPWVMNSEIYCTEARGLGNSIATTVNWSSNLVMSMTFLTLTSQLSPQGAFMLYALISACFFLFFLLYLPETKGK
jgi:SP family myo-inositol transporter-like MFS transporter 13